MVSYMYPSIDTWPAKPLTGPRVTQSGQRSSTRVSKMVMGCVHMHAPSELWGPGHQCRWSYRCHQTHLYASAKPATGRRLSHGSLECVHAIVAVWKEVPSRPITAMLWLLHMVPVSKPMLYTHSKALADAAAACPCEPRPPPWPRRGRMNPVSCGARHIFQASCMTLYLSAYDPENTSRTTSE
jgi:hypothetical protein